MGMGERILIWVCDCKDEGGGSDYSEIITLEKKILLCMDLEMWTNDKGTSAQSDLDQVYGERKRTITCSKAIRTRSIERPVNLDKGSMGEQHTGHACLEELDLLQ